LGGKSSQSTQSVAIPSSVLAAYQSVNSQAQATAATPFQTYGGEFVAPVNAEQTSGINATTANAQDAQPAYAAAEGLTAASAGAVDPTQLTGSDINQYMSPYLGDVLGTTNTLANQNNNIAQSGALGTAISSGAFGGDRTGIAAANLNQQNQLAEQATDANILNTGYNTALSTAQQQQGVDLSAAQANRTALSNAGAQLGSLGSAQQTSALQGANAEIAAGTVQQQTAQAQDTAEYNQFLQQQSYPFQVDSFLANIAEGTGALSGSTTTTTQPGGFFSDRRLKRDIKKVGKTFSGDDIVTYKMGDDPRTRMGLIAQDVEKHNPHAVGLAGGFKTLDYGKATEKAAERGHFKRGGFAAGGDVYDLTPILQAQQQMYAGMGGARSMSGGVGSRVPAATSGGEPHLVTASGGLRQQPTGAQNVATTAGLVKEGQGFYKDYQNAQAAKRPAVTQQPAGGLGSAVLAPNQPQLSANDDSMLEQNAIQASAPDDGSTTPGYSARGGKVGFAAGGMPYSTVTDDTELDIPDVDSHNQLAKAPDLPKQASTGFQQLMSMGSGMGGGMGSMMPTNGFGGGAGGGTDAASSTSDAGEGVEAADDALARGGFARAHKDDGGALDENNPTQIQGNEVDTAPALQQAAPNTSLDSVKHLALAAGEAYLGDYGGAADQVYQGYQSTKQNNAKGGRVRGGFADGGTPDDADPTQDPDVAAGTGMAAAQTGAASSDITGGSKPWYKDTGKLIPLAQALAAMGTAPTKHLGVALAAGLGAGASSYQQQQEALATQANEQSRTQGQNIQNQLAQQKLKYLTTPAPRSPQPGTAQGPPPSDGTLQGNLRAQYYYPQITPQEVSDQQYAHKQAVALGSDQPVKAVQDRIDARRAQADQQNKQDAQSKYDGAVYTYNHAQDPNLRASAAAAADAYRQWTGDEPQNLNGVIVNKRTTQPFIGAEAQRLSPDTYTSLKADANQLVTMPAGDPNDPGKTVQMPKWRANGQGRFNNADEYLASLPPQGTPDVPGRAPTGAPQRPVSAPAPITKAPAVRPAAPQPAAPVVRPGQPPAPSDYLDKTVHDKAFSDPTYRIPQTAAQIGTTFGTKTEGRTNAELEARKALKADSESTIQSSSTALQYANAAQQILDSKNPAVVGKYGPAAAAVSAWLGDKNHDASQYQELAKYLGNLAVQSGKGNFPHATEKENMVQFEQLSPSTANTPEALRGLLGSIVRQNSYMRDTANRSKEYLDDNGYNGSAQDFFKWNQKYFPRESVNTPKSHLDYLVQHPETAPQFKQKYGWLPGGG
jgi:Chaperone of endosialidase